MKLKQTTFYALNVIHRLQLEEDQVVTSTVIAEKEHLSQGVILRILRALANADILCSYRGRGSVCGGFALRKREEDITLLEIVQLMEKVDICEYLNEEMKEKKGPLYCTCSQINEHIREELSKYTIRDMFQ